MLPKWVQWPEVVFFEEGTFTIAMVGLMTNVPPIDPSSNSRSGCGVIEMVVCSHAIDHWSTTSGLSVTPIRA